MASPFLFFVGERLSLAELTAACLDGDLVAIGEGYMPADAVETVWMRARSLAPLAEKSRAVVRRSAAWVHGALDREPSRHELQRASERRLTALSSTRAICSDVRLAPDDVETVAGVLVSTIARTLVDLARSPDTADIDCATAWACGDRAALAQAQAWVARHPRFPYVRRAARLLEGATTR